MEFLIIVDIFFNISPWTGKQISKTKSINELDFFANRDKIFLEQIA